MLRIYHSPTYMNERLYIYQVIFGDFLGVEYTLQPEIRDDVRIVIDGDEEEKDICVNDTLFQTDLHDWLAAVSLPKRPLQHANVQKMFTTLNNKSIPVLYGKQLSNECFYDICDSRIISGIDFFGSSFFMLTRYEEIVEPERDNRQRFEAKNSIVYQEGFLGRPIVNEYVEILWWMMKRLWPRLKRKPRQYQICLSHDVDWAYGVAKSSFPQILKHATTDIVRHQDPRLAGNRILSFSRVKRGHLDADIYNTFEWIMDLSEKKNLRNVFNFITEHTAGKVDGDYSIHDYWIRKLLCTLHGRGHEIGLHTSYNSFCDSYQIQSEFNKLLEVAKSEGIHQTSWGGRQHYLRWEAPKSWQAWNDAGLTYDSTLGFADHVGFRSGVCYPYRTFNLKTHEMLNIIEKPLIVMEGTLLDQSYMGLTYTEARDMILNLSKQCRAVQGEFVVLWHNSYLVHQRDRKLYEDMLQCCV